MASGDRNNHIDGKYEALGDGSPNGIAPSFFGLSMHHDQQVHIAMHSCLSAGVAAEEDDLLRIKAFDDQPGDGLDGGLSIRASMVSIKDPPS